MSYAGNANVVPLNLNLPLETEIQILELHILRDRAILKKRIEIARGLELLREMTTLKTLTLPEGNVPLLNFRSNRISPVNGKVKHIAEAANILSLAVLLENNRQDIMGLIKTPLIIPLKTFIGSATTVTTFGTLKMTRLTIPIGLKKNTSHEQQQI